MLPAQIPVASGANLQTAINSASCGDFLNLEAGATWDGTFTISQNCTAGNPLTIRSANHALLPLGKIGNTQSDTNAHSANMARIRTVGGGSFGAAFVTGTNAGGLVFDGLELTDNAATTANVSMLMDFGLTNGGPHDITVQRCWFHAKETGVNYNRTVQRAVWFEGGNDFLMKWSYVFLIGYYYQIASPDNTTTYQMDTSAFVTVASGDNITLTENFLDTWWNIRFLGGADSPAHNTATLTGATTGSATFSSVTGLAANVIVRMSIAGTGSWNNGTKILTQTGGTTLNSGDGGRAVVANDGNGTAIVMTPSGGGTSSVNCKLGPGISGASVPIIGNNNFATGNVDWIVYQTVRVTGVAGSVVSYSPFGTDFLRHSGAVNAAWNIGDQGLITDVTFTKNTVYLDPVFAENVYTAKGYCNKGVWETKNVNRELVEGNYFLGMPSILGWTAANQNGTSPWIKVDNVTIRSNWIQPDTGHTNCCRTAIFWTDDGYLNTIAMTDGGTVLPNTLTVTNNLILNLRTFLDTKYAGDYFITHNTSINNQSTLSGTNALVSNQTGPATNFVFKDNIGHVVCAGFNGYPGAYPGATILNNVLVDADFGCSGGITVNTFGTGSGLSPVPTLDSQVGFTDLAGHIYSLAPSSNYKNDASDGTDPGVNWLTLLAALGAAQPSTSISGKVTISGKVVIQ